MGDLTIEQNKVLKFLQDNKHNGLYNAKDIHENVFGRCVARRRGFGAVKTNNILRALLNKGLVIRTFTERYEYQINTTKED